MDPGSIGDLCRRLENEGTASFTRSQFRLHHTIDPDKARILLTRCYELTVAERGRRLIADADTMAHIEKTVMYLVAPPPGKNGLLFKGYIGNGKTTLMMAVQRLIGELGRYYGTFEHMGNYFRPRVKIVHAREVLEACLNDKAAYRELATRDMLGIDDLGAEAPEVEQYRNVMMPVADLLDCRYQRGLFTMATTNLDYKSKNEGENSLSRNYGQRIYDRMQEMFYSVNFKNPSYRGG